MIAHDSGPSCSATERLFFERLARAERLVADQRLRVRRLKVGGFDIAQPQALLRLMEAVTEQFRSAWRLYRVHQAPPPLQLGVWPVSAAPSPARGLAGRAP